MIGVTKERDKGGATGSVSSKDPIHRCENSPNVGDGNTSGSPGENTIKHTYNRVSPVDKTDAMDDPKSSNSNVSKL